MCAMLLPSQSAQTAAVTLVPAPAPLKPVSRPPLPPQTVGTQPGPLWIHCPDCKALVSCSCHHCICRPEQDPETAGHSLGGALAVVFAAALASRHPDLAACVAGIYTFGMPRVGDTGFCSNMEAKFPGVVFRITHAADIIPLVCPARNSNRAPASKDLWWASGYCLRVWI